MNNNTFSRSLLATLFLLCITINRGGYTKEGDAAQDNGFNLAEAKISLNKNALQFVQNYIEQNRQDLYIIRQRSQSPFALIDSVFRRFSLPVQLKYLAVIESELKPTAFSRVGAAGPWQLMPETAQLLGLKIAHGRDERTQYDKSTRAAARYLRDLYTEFGDWLLVLAAYNGGPGPVYHAIQKSGSRNFWNLQYYLPAESRIHVKKFIAAHYYFEGHGSITTLTRTERLAFQADYKNEHPGTPVPGILAANW
jgi:membrane-bound lytic murein transglycosylase D